MKNTNVQLALGCFVGLVVAVMIGYIVQTTFFGKKTASPAMPTNLDSAQAKDIIAKVGQENIYKSDLDFEMSAYPPQKGVDKEKLLVQKLVKDSIALQAGGKDGLITLDSTIFNSPQKDYTKRVQLLAIMATKLNNSNKTLKGSLVSIWFFNGRAGAIGYEEGKQVALSRITELHNGVKNKTLTMKQAAQSIINDPSYEQLDTSYKSNAILEFAIGSKEQLTMDPIFDAKIRNLKPGQLTEIYLAKSSDPNTKQKRDSLYMFASVAENEGVNKPNFEDWFKQKESAYEITYY